MKIRIEVRFVGNEFVAFPHVKTETIQEQSDQIVFEFGESDHRAYINKKHILFMETMKEED